MSRKQENKVRNFYYLLAYAFDYDKIFWEEEKEFGTENFKNMYDLFSILIYMYTREILKQGLYSEYISYNEPLHYIKGKIDIKSTIRFHTLKTKNMLVCDYDEYSVNNRLNQIVKTTIYYLLKMDVIKQVKDKLRKIFHCLEDIEIIADYPNIQWEDIRFNILSQKYRPIIHTCKYILNNLIVNKEGKTEKIKMVDDNQAYHQLFEKFLKNYFKKYYYEYREKPIQDIVLESKTIKWQTDSKIENTKLPSMHTDISIQYKKKVKIIDAKFYGHILHSIGYHGYENKDKSKLNSQNWYQMFSYVMNQQEALGEQNVVTSGMLIYAKTEEDNLKEFEVDEFIMKHRIQVKIIDFTQEFGNPYDVNENTIVWDMRNLAECIVKDLE